MKKLPRIAFLSLFLMSGSLLAEEVQYADEAINAQCNAVNSGSPMVRLSGTHSVYIHNSTHKQKNYHIYYFIRDGLGHESRTDFDVHVAAGQSYQDNRGTFLDDSFPGNGQYKFFCGVNMTGDANGQLMSVGVANIG